MYILKTHGKRPLTNTYADNKATPQNTERTEASTWVARVESVLTYKYKFKTFFSEDTLI